MPKESIFNFKNIEQNLAEKNKNGLIKETRTALDNFLSKNNNDARNVEACHVINAALDDVQGKKTNQARPEISPAQAIGKMGMPDKDKDFLGALLESVDSNLPNRKPSTNPFKSFINFISEAFTSFANFLSGDDKKAKASDTITQRIAQENKTAPSDTHETKQNKNLAADMAQTFDDLDKSILDGLNKVSEGPKEPAKPRLKTPPIAVPIPDNENDRGR
jgi:hypothetical protein